MKKYIFNFLMLVLLWGCDSAIKDEPIVEIADAETSATLDISAKRSMSEAIDIATRAISMLGEDESRSGRTVDQSSIIAIKDTKSRGGEADTIMYVVNFEGNNGFVLIPSGQDEAEVLAVTEQGNISNLDSISNPGLKMYIDMATKTKTNPVKAPPVPPFRFQKFDTTYFCNFKRATVKWGQDWPEGYFCPNEKCGCVVTAAVQAFSVLEKPLSIALTYSGKDKDRETFNWPQMKSTIVSNTITPHLIDTTLYAPEYLKLARLCRELGERLNVTYHENGGTASHEQTLRNLLSQMYPYWYVSNYTTGTPSISELRGCPLIIMGGATIHG